MKRITNYSFHKTKYGKELLIDVVPLSFIKPISKNDPVHTLNYYDITLITDGEGEFKINDETKLVEVGDVIFTRPGDTRYWDTAGINEGYAFIFEQEFLLSFFHDPAFIQKLFYFGIERPTAFLHPDKMLYQRILQLIRTVSEEINHYQEKDIHILRALLYESLMVLDRSYREDVKNKPVVSVSCSNSYVSRFLRLVEENYRQEHAVSFYAGELCVTSNYLNELIKTYTGENVKRHIQKYLLTEAKRLLHYTDLPVSVISDRLSFGDPSYFIRFFRIQTQQTPLQFRKQKEQ